MELKPSSPAEFKLKWLRQIQQDKTISYTAFYMCFYLCDRYMLDPDQYIEISQGEIAAGGDIHVRTVPALTKNLMARGHMRFEYRPGKGRKKKFWLLLKEPSAKDTPDHPTDPNLT